MTKIEENYMFWTLVILMLEVAILAAGSLPFVNWPKNLWQRCLFEQGVTVTNKLWRWQVDIAANMIEIYQKCLAIGTPIINGFLHFKIKFKNKRCQKIDNLEEESLKMYSSTKFSATGFLPGRSITEPESYQKFLAE